MQKNFDRRAAALKFFALERNTDEMRLSVTFEFLVAAKRAIRVTAGLRNYASAKLRMAIASARQKKLCTGDLWRRLLPLAEPQNARISATDSGVRRGRRARGASCDASRASFAFPIERRELHAQTCGVDATERRETLRLDTELLL